jgi:hypothetical protein
MIGKQQLALIHVAKNQLGLSDDEYRDLLRSVCGVESSKNLNATQFEKLMSRYKELGFVLVLKEHPKRKHLQNSLKATERDPDALPSPALMFKINELYKELGWVDGNRQIGFNNRVIKKPWPQNRTEANKIIEGLKSMVARRYKKE